jgi:hypothetical protein
MDANATIDRLAIRDLIENWALWRDAKRLIFCVGRTCIVKSLGIDGSAHSGPFGARL